MTLLVALAAAAGTGIVASDDRPLRESCLGTFEQRARLAVFRENSKAPVRKCCGRGPLSERDAIAQQLAQLGRCGDRVRELRHQRSEIIGRHDAAEVVQPVEAEGQSRRVGGFEGEAVGEFLAREANSMFALEQRSEAAADRHVLGVDQCDARILQRFEQLSRSQREAAVAHAHAVVVPEPLGADVIDRQERVVEGGGIDDVTVPLHEQDMEGRDVTEQRLQHEVRIVVARGEPVDRDNVDSRRNGDARRNGVGQEQRPSERQAPAREVERAQRQRVIGGVDARQRDIAKLAHDRFRRCRAPGQAAPRSRGRG